MRYLLTLTAVLATLAAAPSLAQAAVPAAAPVVRTDALIATADGRKLGRIGRIVKKDSVAVAANVIFDSRLIAIPVETITETAKGYTTSLTYADVRKM